LAAPARPEPPPFVARRPAAPPKDPAPSRLRYRIDRFWLTPVYRAVVRIGLPAFLIVFGAGLYLSDPARREAIAGRAQAMIRSIEERPEFMVRLMAIEGASPDLSDSIRAILPLEFPVSSFDLDLDAMHAAVAALDAVESADLRLRAGGVLEIAVAERMPAILWRGPEGLVQLDAEGNPVAPLASRLGRPDLAVVAGEGADEAIPEALALIEAAAPVAARLRGLVRMGERRWDVVLDNGQRILLPEADAVTALRRVMALAEAEGLLARDISVIDMRHGARPTIRLSAAALSYFRTPETKEETEAGAPNG
jgi:cell division protein FtsQ